MKKYPQVLVNVHSDNKAGLDDCQPIWDAVAAAEKELDGRGRILVHPAPQLSRARYSMEQAMPNSSNLSSVTARNAQIPLDYLWLERNLHDH